MLFRSRERERRSTERDRHRVRGREEERVCVGERETDRERQQAKESDREQERERERETRDIAMRDIGREHDGEGSSEVSTPAGTALRFPSAEKLCAGSSQCVPSIKKCSIKKHMQHFWCTFRYMSTVHA